MIVKEKHNLGFFDEKQKAGVQQELDVAFYLRRAFKNRNDVLVFNNLRIEHGGEVAQIDHLIVSTLGFCLIESKSIRAEVSVNKQGEWTRTFNGKKTGMPSPIKQVEAQEKLIKALLKENAPKILGRIFGLVQEGFGGRRWKTICAISSDSVIDRDAMPEEISARVLKSEFIADWVEDAIVENHGIKGAIKKIGSVDPVFSADDMRKISDFLLAEDRPLRAVPKSTPGDSFASPTSIVEKQSAESQRSPVVASATTTYQIACKGCHATNDLTAAYGKFGYYVHCNCGVNTSMKQICKRCSQPMKISKNKETYRASCGCGEEAVIFTAQ